VAKQSAGGKLSISGEGSPDSPSLQSLAELTALAQVGGSQRSQCPKPVLLQLISPYRMT
jgi:hypothetical protein